MEQNKKINPCNMINPNISSKLRFDLNKCNFWNLWMHTMTHRIEENALLDKLV